MFGLKNIRRYHIYLALGFYWIFLLIATSLPSTSLPQTLLSDKIQHTLAFMILGILLTLTLKTQQKYNTLKLYAYSFAIIIGMIYALFDELHQLFIPGRYCEFVDWIADVIGVVLGVGIVYMLIKYVKTFSEKVEAIK